MKPRKGKFPRVTGKKLIKYYKEMGFKETRRKGDHVHMNRPDVLDTITIPDNNKKLPHFLVKNTLKASGISREEFIDGIHKDKKRMRHK